MQMIKLKQLSATSRQHYASNVIFMEMRNKHASIFWFSQSGILFGSNKQRIFIF